MLITEHLNKWAVSLSPKLSQAINPSYIALLEKLGNPQNSLPRPVFHVAGTNGKGSTCAFLRALTEASGGSAHVYTSPHLVSISERIRISGKLIKENVLLATLQRFEQLVPARDISIFEVLTAAAFDSFAQSPAGASIIEVGLGGRLDATNVMQNPDVTIISSLSLDHCAHLGNTLTDIAREKAGIMRRNIPCITSKQSEEATEELRKVAAKTGAILLQEDIDWHVRPDVNGFIFSGFGNEITLPRPALIGEHQLQNAGLALAAWCVSQDGRQLNHDTAIRAMQNVTWPARLQRITAPKLTNCLPDGWELWLDGAHNYSGAQALAAQMEAWHNNDGDEPKSLHIIFGHMKKRNPDEVILPLVPFASHIITLGFVLANDKGTEEVAYDAATLARRISALGVRGVSAAHSIEEALQQITKPPYALQARVVICGSLYLAGDILAKYCTID